MKMWLWKLRDAALGWHFFVHLRRHQNKFEVRTAIWSTFQSRATVL